MSTTDKKRVTSIITTEQEICTDPSVEALFKDIFGIKTLPLNPCEFSVELTGINRAIANGLRRVLEDELTGVVLNVIDFNNEKSTDRFMVPQFVNQRIGLIRLKPFVSQEAIESCEWKLDISNDKSSALTVYAGDLIQVSGPKEVFFNPTNIIARIEPGKRIVIDKIRLDTGNGRQNAKFAKCCAMALTVLDVEQYTDSEQRTDKVIAEQSGYKMTSMISDPSHYRIMGCVAATTGNYRNEVIKTIIEAIDNIKARLQFILSAQLNIVVNETGLNVGTLKLIKENGTIGCLIEAAVRNYAPTVLKNSSVVDHLEELMTYTIVINADPKKILDASIMKMIDEFDIIKKQIK
jgi:hypothetical protein